ncbi:hypothetical protein [Mariniflexile sp.]|uniref:hypothetical protein n=1 Tax=Mariniflexile sp. TaxID=1979402 RepID=UPI003569D24C
MKTLVIGLFLLGFANLSFSQSHDPNFKFNEKFKNVKLDDIVITRINQNYLSAVYNEHTPIRVETLDKKAANFNITNIDDFDNSAINATYRVVFKQNYNDRDKSRMIATYNQNGEILKLNAVHHNIIMTPLVKNVVYSNYPEWVVDSDKYYVNYSAAKGAKKIYKLKLVKANQKKTIKIDLDGKLI